MADGDGLLKTLNSGTSSSTVLRMLPSRTDSVGSLDARMLRKEHPKNRWGIIIAFLVGFLCGQNTTTLSWMDMLEETSRDLSFLHQSSFGSVDVAENENSDGYEPPLFPINNQMRERVGRWPNPTIVVGFPKAGTSSIAAYFRCGGIENIAHHRCNNRACGAIIQKNVEARRNPFVQTGRRDVYIQIDVELNVEKGLPCYFPQVEALHEIHRAHPNSTFLLNTRNVDDWVHSVREWAGMGRRLAICNITGLPPGVGTEYEDLKAFYLAQIDRIRRFVDQYPSHRLVEVPIDVPEAGYILQGAFGIDSRCWGHHNSNTK